MNIQYMRVGDYFIPDLELPEQPRPMGKWGGYTELSEGEQTDSV